MLERLRKKTIGTYVLATLVAFLAGPAFSVHLLADAHHEEISHHHQALDETGPVPHHAQDGIHACALDHDHDNSDAASLAAGCLMPPVTVAGATFEVSPVVYPGEVHRTLPSGLPEDIDKPPRLTASA